MLRELLAFTAQAISHPRQVGAVMPASPALAGSIARAVAHGNCQRVVEVGAGTGAVTRALITHACTPDQITVLERDPSFVRWLRTHLPQVEVIEACATDILNYIEPQVPTAIVSSLPFRSLPRDEARRCAQALADAVGLCSESRLVQYSYGFGSRPPFPVESQDLAWSRMARVLCNLPPASVWALTHINPIRK